MIKNLLVNIIIFIIAINLYAHTDKLPLQKLKEAILSDQSDEIKEFLKVNFNNFQKITTVNLEISAEKILLIEKKYNFKPNTSNILIYKGKTKEGNDGYFFILSKYGMHDEIKLGVFIDQIGQVKGIHLLEHHEDRLRIPLKAFFWQFFKKHNYPLKLGEQIYAITGATTSSSAIIAAVNESRALWEILSDQLVDVK